MLYSLNLNITHVYSDNNFAYHNIVRLDTLYTGKINTQKIVQKHLTFRTRLKRLVRKSICFSKSLHMHEIIFAILTNVLAFNSKLF